MSGPRAGGRRAAVGRALEPVALALLGAAHSLAFTLDGGSWLQLACVALLAWRVATPAPARAALLGWCFGTGWLVAGTWWLYVSMHRYGGLPAPLAAAAVALLSGFLSLYLAAAMAVFARWRRGHTGLDALLFAAGWLLAELARGVIFTGFPWLASGYAHVDGPLASLAPWVGVYGIGFVSAALAAGVGAASGGRGRALAAGLGAVVLGLAAALGPGEHTRPSGALAVSLLQGNVAQDEKFAAEHLPEALDWTRRQLLGARGELVIGPETVIPLLPYQLEPGYWEGLLDHFRAPGRAALVGLPLGDESSGYTNSAAGLSAGTANLAGGFYRYDKHHLVPFGEFVPTGFHWFTRMMDIPLGDFNRGPLVAPSFEVRGAAGNLERVAPNICYEDLFGEELAARFADPAVAPTVFANISNIGWFGHTVAVPQHLQISRMRTLEFQLPMVRATNTGATAVIDHHARVTARLEPFTQGVLEARVEGRAGVTPFAKWAARFGLGPLWALGGAVVASMALAARRRPGRGRS